MVCSVHESKGSSSKLAVIESKVNVAEELFHWLAYVQVISFEDLQSIVTVIEFLSSFNEMTRVFDDNLFFEVCQESRPPIQGLARQ